MLPVVIRVVEVRPGRWSYMIDGEFPADLYDAARGLTTFASPDEARRAASLATRKTSQTLENVLERARVPDLRV